MNRRTFLQTSGVGLAAMSATAVSTPVSANRDLVTHTVAHALREMPPLLVYSGLQITPIDNAALIQNGGGSPEVLLWNDWNDDDLASVFAAFSLGSKETTLGTIRIFDTADIAWNVHRPDVEERAQRYIDVGGMRAAIVHRDDSVFASLRLWNVVIDAVAPDDSTDIAMGIVKHLGTAIGALEPSH